MLPEDIFLYFCIFLSQNWGWENASMQCCLYQKGLFASLKGLISSPAPNCRCLLQNDLCLNHPSIGCLSKNSRDWWKPGNIQGMNSGVWTEMIYSDLAGSHNFIPPKTTDRQWLCSAKVQKCEKILMVPTLPKCDAHAAQTIRLINYISSTQHKKILYVLHYISW